MSIRRAHILLFAIFLAGIVVGSIATFAIMTFSAKVTNVAKIKTIGVGVYEDAALTIPLTEIDWGFLEPGEQKNFTAFIKNKSNIPITLTLITENWIPSNTSNFMTLTWDYDGQPLQVDGFVQVTFTLAVDPAISGIDTFTFDIVIIGSG